MALHETWTFMKADGRRLEAFHINCQRRILGIRWFHFVTNASVTSQTGEAGLAIRICRRRLSIFGYVRWLPEATPAHSARRLGNGAGGKPDIRPEWKRQRGRPCRTWVQQIEDDTGLNANDAWRIAHDRKCWRAIRPVAGQAFRWVSEEQENESITLWDQSADTRVRIQFRDHILGLESLLHSREWSC